MRVACSDYTAVLLHANADEPEAKTPTLALVTTPGNYANLTGAQAKALANALVAWAEAL